MVFTEYPKQGIAACRAMQYLSAFQVIKPNVFIGQPMRGIVGVLCSFEIEHYPSNSIDPWCLIAKYLNEGICFLISFGKATQYPCMCQKICYGAQCISGILGEG
jgi:hypothetical protein